MEVPEAVRWRRIYIFLEAVKHVLETDGVRNEAESDITLDIHIATGEDAHSFSSDYSDILIFLRKLVSNGDIASMERVLHALKKLERTSSRSGRMSDSVSAISPAHPGCGTAVKRTCYRTHDYERVEICAKVGEHRRHELGPKCLADRRTALLQASRSPVQRQAVVYAPPDIRELVNMECRSRTNDTDTDYFDLTLLHCAIFTGNEKMVKCLLKWGADATSTLVFEFGGDFPGHAWKHTPIGVAAVLKHAGVVKCLLASGASPYDGGSWGPRRFYTYGLCRYDAATCEALCQNPKYPPPVSETWSSQQHGCEECFMRMLPYCRWDTACCRGGLGTIMIAHMKRVPELFRESFLGMASFTVTERLCKRFWCALNLRKACYNNAYIYERLHGKAIDTAELTSFAHSLLQEGTDPAGLSISDADALCSAWLQLSIEQAELHGHRPPVSFMSRERLSEARDRYLAYFHSRAAVLATCVKDETKQQVLKILPRVDPHLSVTTSAAYFSFGTPPVVHRLLLTRTAKDPVVELLVKHGGLPGISSVDEIPFVDGCLHDGPSCYCNVELSAAQRKVSLLDVLTPRPKPKSLAHLCRSAVIEACHGYGVVKAIQSLDLPPVLLSYLLFQ